MKLFGRFPEYFGRARAGIPSWLLSRIGVLCGPVRGLLSAAGIESVTRSDPSDRGQSNHIVVEVESRDMVSAGHDVAPVPSEPQGNRVSDEDVTLEEALSRSLALLGEAAAYLAGILDVVDDLDKKDKDALVDACRYFAEVREFLEEQ